MFICPHCLLCGDLIQWRSVTLCTVLKTTFFKGTLELKILRNLELKYNNARKRLVVNNVQYFVKGNDNTVSTFRTVCFQESISITIKLQIFQCDNSFSGLSNIYKNFFVLKGKRL